MNASAGEKVLAGELLVSFTVEWLGAVVKLRTAPSPRQMLGIPLTFSLLALVAAVGGEHISKVVAGIGGLVTLTIVLKALGSVPAAGGTNPIIGGLESAGGLSSGGAPAVGMTEQLAELTGLS